MNVKPHHPLMELLAKLLSGIQVVPAKEQRRMVNRACKEATKWHKEQVDRFEWWVCDMEKHIMATKGKCPECDHWIDIVGHARDCDIFLLVERHRKELAKTRKKNSGS